MLPLSCQRKIFFSRMKKSQNTEGIVGYYVNISCSIKVSALDFTAEYSIDAKTRKGAPPPAARPERPGLISFFDQVRIIPVVRSPAERIPLHKHGEGLEVIDIKDFP